MKKLIIPIVIIVAFLGVAALAYGVLAHREAYIAEQQASQVTERGKAEAERRAQVEALENQLAAERAETERLRAECEKGVVTYSNLSGFMKTSLEPPVCVVEPVTEPVPAE